MEFTITNKKGEKTVVFYDSEDHEIISQYNWHLSSGYVAGRKKNKRDIGRQATLMHRLLIGFPPDGYYIDHINQIKSDNRRGNLRFCSFAQNMMNRPKCKGVCKYIGVKKYGSGPKYITEVTALNILYRVGIFGSQEEGAIERDIKSMYLHGEFCCLNFPEYSIQYALALKSSKEECQLIKKQLLVDKIPKMKDIVCRSTANLLKRSGFPQPSVEIGQIWYAEKSITLVIDEINLEKFKTCRIKRRCVFAPTPADIMSELTPDYFLMRDFPVKGIIYWQCKSKNYQSEKHTNPSEACALAFMDK